MRRKLPRNFCKAKPNKHERVSSKFVGHGAVKSAALTELRRTDTDAAAGAQFIDFVEQVHHIETDFEGSLLRDLDPA